VNAADLPDDEFLQYRDEEVEAVASGGKGDPWKILVADDDNAVHLISMAVLRDFEFEGRPVQLLSAHSGEAAKQLMTQQPDIALVLLDVVMESDTAGLDVVRYIRNELRNRAVRIVLRTGQPGQAPERDVITSFDINDYKEKTELTAQKLVTAVVSALRAYRDIVTIERSRRGLQKVIEASRSLFKPQVIATFAECVLAQVAGILGRGQTSGFVANRDASRGQFDFHVLAGTGVYAASVGAPVPETVAPDAKDFVARFVTTNGTENLVYVEGARVLEELDEQLLSVFSANLAVAFDNAYLHEQLREREERLSSIIETATDAVITIDSQQRVVVFNDAAATMFGVPASEALGRFLENCMPGAPHGERSGFVDVFSSMIGPSAAAGGLVRLDGVRADAHTFPIEMAMSRTGEGERLFVTAVIRDMSGVLEVERARAAQLAAEASNLAKSEFISRMSHELRTPLNAIMGYTQILKWDLGLTKRQSTGLDTIHLSGEHLIGLIDEILDLARVEAGKLELHETPIELHPFLVGIANIARVRVEQKGLAFAFDNLDMPCTVLADERRLRQVLLNLLSNAARFTDQGQVTLRARRMPGDGPEAAMRFEVQDSGVGISADDLKTLFQPFHQLGDLERRRGGTGLGLTISRQLVSHMGGEIHVRSEPGKGSTFWFELRMRVTTSRAAQANELTAIGYEGARKTVLIVDDTPENRMVLIHMLEPLGFATVEAENGKQGLERALASAPDLVLMDNVMPVMDGLETTRRMRESPELAQVPVITLSADATSNAKEKALAAGATAVLTKPVRATQLLDLLEQHLGIRFIRH